MNLQIVLLCLTHLFLKCSESAKILGVFPLAGRSLNILSNKLMLELANAGHEVTVVAAHKPKGKLQKGSLRYIHLTGFWEDYEKLTADFDPWNVREESDILSTMHVNDLLATKWNGVFEIPEVKKLLTSNETFDAVILHDLWQDCFKILSQIFKCPLIMLSTLGGNGPLINEAIGNPLPPSYVPHIHKVGPHFKGMNFFHRVHNFIFYIVDYLVQYFYVLPSHNKILQEHFNNPADIGTYYTNISLVLLGSHSSFGQAAPLLPNVVEIGGFHIDPPKKLPKDLQEFLDGAKDGFIYFSLGSHVHSKDLPTSIKMNFLNVFRKLKQKVLWKFEEDLPDKPDNVLIKDWLPQMDVLAHPNIKFFITHAGQGSTTEAIYHGVPCLMIPVFLDQFNVAYQAVQQGFALKINYRDATESTLMNAMVELLENPKYRNNAKKIQQLFHDRPMKPIDTAIYWIEYVIRHKGADHLKVGGLNMPWYQFYCIDVIVFLLASLFVVLYCFNVLFRTLLCRKKSDKKQKIH